MKYILKLILLSLLTLTVGKYTEVKALEREGINTPVSIAKTTVDEKVMYVATSGNQMQYSWKFDNPKLEDVGIDLHLNFYSFNKKIIDNLIKEENVRRQYVSFVHHGPLPSDATVKVKAKDFKDNERLYLYYYNDKKEQLQYIEKDLVVKDGYVEFSIEHCSDYILTGSIIKTATDNPNSMGTIIIIMIVILVGVIAATLFSKSK